MLRFNALCSPSSAPCCDYLEGWDCEGGGGGDVYI